MTYETIEKRQCRGCRKINFCVLVEKDWFCELCYGWTKEHADIKDQTRKIMIQCGIEDLE